MVEDASEVHVSRKYILMVMIMAAVRGSTSHIPIVLNVMA
jgi:hypothetical protein